MNPHVTLRRNSKVYMMLKHGPLPAGDYSYLIVNGTLTRYARWLLIAYELNLSFMTLLILSKIYQRYINTHNSTNKFEADIQRDQFYGQMGWDFERQSIVDMITPLIDRGYCKLGMWHSVIGVSHTLDALEKKYDSELREMHDYFDEIFPSNIFDSAA